MGLEIYKGGYCAVETSNKKHSWKVEVLASFKLGNGRRLNFWTDSWAGDIPLNLQFPKLFRIALLPNGSTTAHWDTATKYWSIVLHRLLKYKEIPDFQSKLLLLSSKRVTDLENSRVWSLGPSGRSSEIPFSSPCPHLPRWTKLHSKLFGRPAAKESQHINLDYGFQSPKLFLDHSEKTPRQVLAALSVPSLYEGQRVWAFDGSLCSNVFQLLRGPLLPKRLETNLGSTFGRNLI
ncbi:hypothetical protein E5676_scaffold98G001230 [Cucumis melo var. makuwa]|uniref:Reverse transcriptase zinc-binding domain-containing protein n=1 Tax=Cucumis melo var. makuwa TaxID=1194695 RepID=A0A5D3C2U2_CUCMM|nr:hypothetical protein E6C27_scaffold262G001930 [Cucumis melo var. makuwa]TYK05660.1 hypothetical protein E5676_scaffold98G001230 [Cucumis melo var. makuwa]